MPRLYGLFEHFQRLKDVAPGLFVVSFQVNYATKLQVETGPGRTRGYAGILHDQFSTFITLISLLIIAIRSPGMPDLTPDQGLPLRFILSLGFRRKRLAGTA